MLFFAVAAAAPADLPVWAVLLGLVLTGGTVSAVFQYLTKRNETRAGSSSVEATANLTGVQALTHSIQTLSTENGRLTTRLTEWDAAFGRLESKLDASRDQVAALQMTLEERPTKKDLIEQIGKLIDQLRSVGETPTNGPIK